MTIESLIAKYGIAAVFFGAGLEGETVVATGGLFAHRGLLPMAGVIAAAAAGSFLADQIFFLIGRRFRDHRYVKRIIERRAFARAHRMIDRHPIGFVFAFRFLWGLRTVSPIALGTTSLSWSLFAGLNALAAILWAGVIATAGYSLAASLAALGTRLLHLPHLLLAIAALAVVFIVLGVWLRRRL